MPDPVSRRGVDVTEAAFTAPFSTPIFPYGIGGLDLNSAIDKIAPGNYARLTNAYSTPFEPRALTARPGQQPLATAGTMIHSIVRMDDPQTNSFTRVWGVDTNLFLGASGALTQIDSGYSGEPLCLLPHRPTLSGDPWTFIADAQRMRKVREDGLTLEIGLAAPTFPAAAALGDEQQTLIASFLSGSDTAGTLWTGNRGFDYSAPPNQTDPPMADAGLGGSTFTPQPGATILSAGNGYFSFWGVAKTLNLNRVGGLPASDDDIMHLLIQFGNPALVAECRLYAVCSATFSPSVLPGTSGAANQDFYVKSFRPSDFSAFVGAGASQIDTAEVARTRQIRQQALTDLSVTKGFAQVRDPKARLALLGKLETIIRRSDAFLAQYDPERNQSAEAGGANSPFEFGVIGSPLRRGDWKRYGNTTGRDWGTVTGLIVYLQSTPTADSAAAGSNLLIFVTLHDWYLTGGSGPDTIQPDSQSYDYRFTHYDPRTGAESNPSPLMETTNFMDSLRREIVVTPQAYGDGAIRQRVYRRGGALTDNWYFEGVTDSDGGVFSDRLNDEELSAAGTVEIDHYQPVPTVNDAGETVLAQPVPMLFGPYNGQLFALGDPYRPGHVYASLPGEPDHWPPDLVHEVCAPSEELLAGFLYGGQPYVFSRERLYVIYPNIAGVAGMSSAPTECRIGLAGRWAYCVGAGAIWAVSAIGGGVFKSGGGAPEDVSGPIKPLFRGQRVNGYAPIDLSVETMIRLEVWHEELYFTYQDTDGNARTLVLQILTGLWRAYTWGRPLATIYADGGDGTQLLLGGQSTGAAYTHEGMDDDGDDIQVDVRTGAQDFGRPREDKLFGDQILDVDSDGAVIHLQNYLNNETVVNASQPLTAPAGRNRAIFDSFGPSPQKARNLSTHLSWLTGIARPILYFLGTSITVQPDLTINRVTTWDDLGHPDEKYVIGVTFDCDTGGVARTIIIERDYQGVISEVATLSVTANGRHKVAFSWAGVQANQIRIRPNDDCLAWILYRADWIWFPEPPRIAGWDIHFEADGDKYYTGLDLYCDTGGAQKTIVVTVDNQTLSDPATGLPYWTIQTIGRQWIHLTLPTGRGHVFHFASTDANLGILYTHKWYTDPEPSEQANWNQNFSILGTRADKWLKAVIFECDTFGVDKTVRIEVDGTLAATLTVNTQGRKVVQLALPEQKLGRVWRMIPSDSNPSRLYSAQPIFDEEPFQLTRWETQETNHAVPGFQSLIEAQVTLKSTTPVTLTVITHVNQLGTTVTDTYEIPSTGGVKQMRFVPFKARKGCLFKYLFTSDLGVHLYQEESHVIIQPFDGGSPVIRHPWGNSDLTVPTRSMTGAVGAAEAPGGG